MLLLFAVGHIRDVCWAAVSQTVSGFTCAGAGAKPGTDTLSLLGMLVWLLLLQEFHPYVFQILAQLIDLSDAPLGPVSAAAVGKRCRNKDKVTKSCPQPRSLPACAVSAVETCCSLGAGKGQCWRMSWPCMRAVSRDQVLASATLVSAGMPVSCRCWGWCCWKYDVDEQHSAASCVSAFSGDRHT